MSVDLQKWQQIQGMGKNPNLTPAQKKAIELQKLKMACQGFEALFVKQLLKGMRSTVIKSGYLDGGMKTRLAEDMMDQALANQVSKSGQLGLANMLYKQLSNKTLVKKPKGLERDQLGPLNGGRLPKGKLNKLDRGDAGPANLNPLRPEQRPNQLKPLYDARHGLVRIDKSAPAGILGGYRRPLR